MWSQAHPGSRIDRPIIPPAANQPPIPIRAYQAQRLHARSSRPMQCRPPRTGSGPNYLRFEMLNNLFNRSGRRRMYRIPKFDRAYADQKQRNEAIPSSMLNGVFINEPPSSITVEFGCVEQPTRGNCPTISFALDLASKGLSYNQTNDINQEMLLCFSVPERQFILRTNIESSEE
jgi:hypothetical protein